MAVIQVEIDDALAQAMGMRAVEDFIERQLSLLRLRHLGERISDAIRESGIDHDAEVDAARQEAWREYKEKHLRDAS